MPAFGRASLILSARPPKLVPFRSAIARSASTESVISTKAKPRARPVSRSVTRLTRSTFPYGSKSVRREDSVAPKSKFPTKMFFMLLNVGLSSVRARRGGFEFGQVVARRQKLTLSLPRQKAGQTSSRDQRSHSVLKINKIMTPNTSAISTVKHRSSSRSTLRSISDQNLPISF